MTKMLSNQKYILLIFALQLLQFSIRSYLHLVHPNQKCKAV